MSATDMDNINTSSFDLEQSKMLFAMPVPVLEINYDAEILNYNKLAEKLILKSRHSIDNLNLIDISCKSSQPGVYKALEELKVLQEEENVKIEVNWKSLEGDYITLLISFSKYTSESSEKIFVILEDITKYEKIREEYQRHYEEIQIARDDLEERSSELAIAYEKLRQSELDLETISRNKDRFFSIISHDLRSPFSSLLGLTSLVLNDFDKFSREEIKDSMYNLHQVSEGLYRLIEDLLDWSRIQFNKIVFEPELLNLNEVVQKVISISKSVAKDKNISLVNIVPKNCTTMADEHMITTIIRNLVNNAIKFTPKYGFIKITAGFHLDDLIVSVEDTGVGMSGEVIANLFKVGKKVSKYGTEGESGTGLGLIICKEFVEKHGGKIWAESEVEKGSKFIFRIPTEPEISNPD